ncbi:MarR family winged helix-turn-helix transcriptional regulator [Sphingomonas sp. Mn802worker]|uniref:MarR family winged helix-turn-helix transcriptional regulator n=1 Tax=Sphingomonas sp. Mn802worker TaxID=629773 RepID=UPI000372B762|nr:MarR family winged helix-turn-helix transcriptional regulator [Sphingomonas sp. Mn802worker]
MSVYTRDTFFPDTSIGYLLRASHQLGYALLDRVCADHGITGIQWSTMIAIHFGMTNCAALARDLAHDKGAMTRVIDVLETKGLVQRDRDDADRRLVNLSLTQEGDAVAMRCRDGVIALWNAVLADWSADEAASLIAQLQKLRRTLEHFA